MNKIQRLQHRITKELLNNEIELYGRIITSYKDMRKYVNKHLFDRKNCIKHFKALEK